MDAGGFGDLPGVCQDGDASGATDTGVTDTDIHVATFTDKGFSFRPGLTKEMYDAAVAFTSWCNEHGGILGRQLVLDDRDAKLTEYNARILESCVADFAMVGGGAVSDDADNGARVACGLPNIPGYVVTDEARSADLQVQPVPNPVGTLAVGGFRRARELYPDLTRFGIMTGAYQTTQAVRDLEVAGAEQLGYEKVYTIDYSVNCEPDWGSFITDMQTANVEVLEFVGEPECFTALQKAMDTAGWFPALTLQNTNFYDQKYADEGGPYAQNTFIRTAFYPFERSSENKATQDYLDLMEQYNPSGKVAQLGVQGLSGWLLFATAATECGSELTRQCLLEKAGAVTEWTGGGLHAATNPSANTPSDCVAVLEVTADGFVYDEEFTNPNDGIFYCDPANLVPV
jgi:hypothetical protein